MLEKIIGIRPEVNNPYSIYEGLVKPEWGFPGGAIQLFAGENIGKGFSRIGRYLEETLGIKGMVTETLEGLSGRYMPVGRKKASGYISIGSSYRSLFSERFNPRNPKHLSLQGTIRHEAGHAVLDVAQVQYLRYGEYGTVSYTHLTLPTIYSV